MKKRPVLVSEWWPVAPWILGHQPAHRIYVEPYDGAASEHLRKARSDKVERVSLPDGGKKRKEDLWLR